MKLSVIIVRALSVLTTALSSSLIECNQNRSLSEANLCFGNERCTQSADGNWTLIFSESCQVCEGGSVEDDCHGGLNQCFDDVKCVLTNGTDFSGNETNYGNETKFENGTDFVGNGTDYYESKICTLEHHDECYCQLGDEGTDCGGDEGKCFRSGKICTFKDGSCTLSTDFFACCDGVNQGASFENNCNSFLGECIDTSLCSLSGTLESSSCFVEKNSAGCFCNGVKENDCGGDLTKCMDGDYCDLDDEDDCFVRKKSEKCLCYGAPADKCRGKKEKCFIISEEKKGRCIVNEEGQCQMVNDFTCCTDGDNSNSCNGYETECDGTSLCEYNVESEQCRIVESFGCFCRGNPENDCDGDVGTCLGEYGCAIEDNDVCVYGECLDNGDDGEFCEGEWYEGCKGDLNSCSGDMRCIVNGTGPEKICEVSYDFTCRMTPAPTGRITDAPSEFPTLTFLPSTSPSISTSSPTKKVSQPPSVLPSLSPSSIPTSKSRDEEDRTQVPSAQPSIILSISMSEYPTTPPASFAAKRKTSSVFFISIMVTTLFFVQ